MESLIQDTDYQAQVTRTVFGVVLVPRKVNTKTGQLNTFSRLQALELIYCVKEGGVVCVKGLPNEFTTNGSECDPFVLAFLYSLS